VSQAKTVTVQVRLNGAESNFAELSAIPNDLEIFRGLDPQLPNFAFAYAINGGKVNSAANPAKTGEIVAIFVNGAGLLTPEPLDGAAQSIGPIPVLPVSVSFGGYSPIPFFVPCEVLYAGAAPKQVAGKVQINFRVPSVKPEWGFGPLALVQVSAGGQQTVANIWMAAPPSGSPATAHE
jgi:uncharacterized protein (TIGR03437 family)